MVEIREMRIEDYDQVMDLWLHTPEFGSYPRAYTPERLAKYLDRNPGLSTVAIAGHRNGLAMGGHLSWEEPRGLSPEEEQRAKDRGRWLASVVE